jgi:integrase
MPRKAPITGLSAAKIRTAKPGRYADGHGLALVVASDGRARSWALRYRLNGKSREMGLGPAAGQNAVSLVEARERAADLLRLVRAGVDPLEKRDTDAAALAAATQKAKIVGRTFGEVAKAYIETHAPDWRSARHYDQWVNSLRDHVLPVIGNVPAALIERKDVLAVLQPIWRTLPETASRIRGRIERILDFAEAEGLRAEGSNPARYAGALARQLGAQRKMASVRHFAAMPYRAIPAFLVALRARDGTPAELALEFLVLTAARSSEVTGARWGEIDQQSATWTVPAARMKGHREHRVPMSAAAMAVIRKAEALRQSRDADDLVFPAKPGSRKALHGTSLSDVLRRMGVTGVTIHGFRSAYRDWASEQTAYAREVVELSLAHAIGNAVERAYARSDLLDRRRTLASAWAEFLSRPFVTGEVVPFRVNGADTVSDR